MSPKLRNVKGAGNWLELIIDILMVVLVVLDLAWLVFDALFTVEYFKAVMLGLVPGYEEIHKNFLVYDGIIVTIFLTEFFFRWGLSILRKEHRKWFFYPFVHWYDVLGCIPTSSFRVLRLLRVAAMLFRLHNWGVIDLNRYYLYRVLLHYYNIVVEEIADRVVIKVLEQAKNEMEAGKPITDAVLEEVVRPRKDQIAAWLAEHVRQGLREKYPEFKPVIQQYVEQIVQESVTDDKRVNRLGRMPVIGNQIHDSLNAAVSNIVFGVVDRLATDFASLKSSDALQTLIETILEVLTDTSDPEFKALPTEIVSDTIDLIIKRVQVKKWQENEL